MTSNLQHNSPIPFFDKKYRVIHHILFWLFVWFEEIFEFLAYSSIPEAHHLVSMAVIFAVIYTNLYWFLPLLLEKHRIVIYAVSTILSIAVFVFFTVLALLYFQEVDNPAMKDRKIWDTAIFYFMVGSCMVGLAVAFKFFKLWLKNQEKIKSLEHENLKSKLGYLKSQVNPHFLFNSLNNIYVLTRKDQKLASEMVLGLSDLMRYQLYECSKDAVMLTDEIEYIKNFLELDNIRKSGAEVVCDVVGNPSGIVLPPLLFMPFVENAVKHGFVMDGSSYITAKFFISEETVTFIIQNSKMNAKRRRKQTKYGGFGLPNIKRRLELLYPHKHLLYIIDNIDSYKVELKLELK